MLNELPKLSVRGDILEEPLGNRGCGGDVKHSKRSRRENDWVRFTNSSVWSAEMERS